MSKIQVMLADDHTLVRQGLRRMLEMEEDIEVVSEATNGKGVLEAIREGARPNVVLMDVQMPAMSGIEATRRVLELAPTTRVVALTAVDEDVTIAEMLHAGACGYIVKSAGAEQLVGAIRKAHLQRSALTPGIRQRMEQYQRHRPVTSSISCPQGAGLTERELDVMRILLEGHSNKEIARKLYISERTVQTHLSNIFHKIKVNSRTEAVLVAVREGWFVTN